MWNIILVLACNAVIALLAWWVRRSFPQIQNWVPLTAALFLGIGVVPLAAFEQWREIVLYGCEVPVGVAIAAFVTGVTITVVIQRFRVRKAQTSKEPQPAAVYFLDALAIVDAYIGPALRDKREIDRVTIRHDFMKRFEKVTGAKLGEFQYNRALLHQWMQSNAARFLVERRKGML